MSFQRRASAFDLARRAGARYVGVNSADSAGLEEYMASGTYTPTVTTNGSATVEPALLSGYSRVGNGAGVPSAGDTVHVFGFLHADGLADGEVITVTLPFEVSTAVGPYAAVPIMDAGNDLSARLEVSDVDTASLTFTVTTDTSSESISWSLIYQTANAIDP